MKEGQNNTPLEQHRTFQWLKVLKLVLAITLAALTILTKLAGGVPI